MTRILLFDAKRVEPSNFDGMAQKDVYQHGVSNLITGVCVSILTPSAFDTLFNEGAINARWVR